MAKDIKTKVRFLKGTSEQYQALIPDEYTFYFTTDDEKFYLGDIELSNGNIQYLQQNLNELALSISAINDQLEDTAKVFVKTTEEWGYNPSEQSQKNTFYIYSDHTSYNGTKIPGIKIGDGNAYIADLPFIDDLFVYHINDNVRHITQEERDRWNNKVRTYYEKDDMTSTATVEGEELLVFTKK